jgi:hypothetical protein
VLCRRVHRLLSVLRDQRQSLESAAGTVTAEVLGCLEEAYALRLELADMVSMVPQMHHRRTHHHHNRYHGDSWGLDKHAIAIPNSTGKRQRKQKLPPPAISAAAGVAAAGDGSGAVDNRTEHHSKKQRLQQSRSDPAGGAARACGTGHSAQGLAAVASVDPWPTRQELLQLTTLCMHTLYPHVAPCVGAAAAHEQHQPGGSGSAHTSGGSGSTRNSAGAHTTTSVGADAAMLADLGRAVGLCAPVQDELVLLYCHAQWPQKLGRHKLAKAALSRS